jgi:hypothetical protein
MSDNLRDLIAKMKAENSQSTPQKSVNTNPKPQKAVAKPIEEEIEEEFDESIDLDQDDPVENKMNLQQKTPQKAPETQENIDLSEQIRSLHDEGIYRLQKLGLLNQINNNLRIIAGVLVDYKK